ncbi:TrlF family AAA-like ATPase [Vibrio sp. M260112]|uniref:TrlF family AAA-like ATPase n=1 Tax=Vibrio sp. M260112 TaxID=3020895 RepID=UPI002F42D383
MSNVHSRFSHGSEWVRADFHLHTRADKEFKYSGSENDYINSYIAGLEQAGIGLGVISNHNKFSLDEFKQIRKKARKKEIGLLPGVELSVKDGQAGIHTLVIFSDEWIINKENENYIQSFLNVTFAGQANFEQENARSNHDLKETIRELDKFEKDYFLIFAHVEADNGLWGALKPGPIGDLFASETFRKRALGFQKVSTHDKRIKLASVMDGYLVAEVEGSDPKSIEQIGKGKASYLKVGDFVFDAVKFALINHQCRVSDKPKKIEHSHIESIHFEGEGSLGGQIVTLSPELNTLIGIRGSGKSSLLEAIRYALNIPLGTKSMDKEYKQGLVHHLLNNGGAVCINAVDRHGQPYQIKRINNQAPDVLVDGVIQPGVSIRETVLHNPIYFGQKDLSSSGEGFEKDLIEKLVGDSLEPIRQKIADKKQAVLDIIGKIKKLSSDKQTKQEWTQKKQDAEFSLKIYQDNGIEEKLQKQIEFDRDERKLKDATDTARSFYSDLQDFVDEQKGVLQLITHYQSKENEVFFEEYRKLYQPVLEQLDLMAKMVAGAPELIVQLESKLQSFVEAKNANKEAFAEMERKLSAELREKGVQSLKIENFRKIKSQIEQASKVLKALDLSESKHQKLRGELSSELAQLEQLRIEEFNQIEKCIERINQKESPLKILATYKTDAEATLKVMQDAYRGSGLRSTTLQGLVGKFGDFCTMRDAWDEVRKEVSSYEVFNEYFQRNIEDFLIWQVPNQFEIEYHGKALRHHSLGQRASALMLFVLSQQDNDVVIIDQPEDDLDNQTIYDDVIKMLVQLKPSTQFIFATHNANIPVLGDAEQVICCHYEDQKTGLESGSIDNKQTQQQIVSIMEGGQEAFEKRKQVYEVWKS